MARPFIASQIGRRACIKDYRTLCIRHRKMPRNSLHGGRGLLAGFPEIILRGQPATLHVHGYYIGIDGYGGRVGALEKEATEYRVAGASAKNGTRFYGDKRRFLLLVFGLRPFRVSPPPFRFVRFLLCSQRPVLFNHILLGLTQNVRRRLNSHSTPSQPKHLVELHLQ